MSTTETTGEFGPDECARIDEALADEAVHRRLDAGVLQRDPQFVEPGLGLFELRAREIELGECRLIPRLRVVERLLWEQLALEQAARSIEVGLRELEIRLPLADGRFADLNDASA